MPRGNPALQHSKREAARGKEDSAREESAESKAFESAEKEDKSLHKTVNKMAKKIGVKSKK
jgi:hypothetical protein